MARTSVGQRRHAITVQTPGAPAADGDGGYTQTFVDVAPAMAAIVPAAARDLERVASGTVISMATHLVTFRYMAGVTTKARIVFGDRTFSILGVMNPEERNIDLVCICAEVVL